MNWEDIENSTTNNVLSHWQKLGTFRRDHPSVGAGTHEMLSAAPYVFKRSFDKNGLADTVVIGLDLNIGVKEILVGNAFAKAQTVKDTYSGQEASIIDGKITLDTPYDIVLLEAVKN